MKVERITDKHILALKRLAEGDVLLASTSKNSKAYWKTDPTSLDGVKQPIIDFFLHMKWIEEGISIFRGAQWTITAMGRAAWNARKADWERKNGS